MKLKNKISKILVRIKMRTWIGIVLIAVLAPIALLRLFYALAALPTINTYWKFDEASGATANDATTNGNNGTITNATWVEEGRCAFGNCLFYDGTDDRVSLADDADFDFTGAESFTFSTWFRHAPKSSGTDVILAKIEATGTDGGYRIQMESDGDITCEIEDDDANTVIDDTISSTAATYDDNQWHYVACVKSTTASLTLYIDGRQVAQDASLDASSTLANDETFYFGSDDTGSTNEFTGFLDEFKLYRTALTAAEIKVDYSGGAAIFAPVASDYLTEGLAGYWKMDETSGNMADSSGNGTTLTDTNTVAFVAGKFGYGGDFESGNSEYQFADDNASLSITADLTISVWIKPESTTASTLFDIVGKFDGSNESYQLALFGDEIRFYIDSSSNYATTSAADLATGTWYHIVGTYQASGGTVKIYVNGIESTSTVTGTIPNSIGDDAGRFHIGAEDSTTTAANFFDGVMDEARVYTRTMSPAEVRQLYNWSAGPVGHWKLDENTGTSTSDSSGNSNTGTITAGVGGFVPGRYGSGHSFDSSNTLINTGSGTTLDNLPATGMTIEAWIYPTSQGEAGASFVLAKNVGTGPSAGWILQVNNTLALLFRVDGATDLVRNANNNVLVSSAWNHVAVSWDGEITTAATADIYVNGTEVTYLTTTNGATRVDDATSSFFIGNDSTSARTFGGTIDEARVYNYTRNAIQIVEDMNASHPIGGSPIDTQVVAWAFDEGQGTSANSTGIATTGTGTLTNISSPATSTSGWTPNGKTNKAIIFDGSDDQVAIATASDAAVDFNTAEQFSISAWIYPTGVPTSTTDEDLIAGKWDETSAQRGYRIFLENDDTDSTGRISVEIYDESADQTISVTSGNDIISENTWYHVAFTFNGGSAGAAKDLNLYVNGRHLGGNSANTSFLGLDDVTSDYTVGDYDATDTDTDLDAFTGRIDEVKVYSGVLSLESVRMDMNGGAISNFGYVQSSTNEASQITASTTDAPILEWKLDENTGTSATDTSGNANTGTLTNTPTWTTGKYGSALSFAAANQHVTIADDADLDFAAAESFTIQTWFRHDTATATETLASKIEATGNDGGYKIKMESDGDLTCEIEDDDANTAIDDTISSTAATYDDNQWHYVVCIKNATTSLTLYIDGVQIAQDASLDASSTLANDDAFFYGIESATGTEDWVGQLDQLMVYRYVRNQAQLMYDFNRGRPYAWWKLDDNVSGNAQTINDSSGYGFTATTNDGANDTGMDCTVSGKYNTACDFDGTDDYIDSNMSPDFGANGFSVTLWIKTTATTGDYIFGSIYEAGANDPAIQLSIDGDGACTDEKITIFVRTSTGNETTACDVISSTSVSDNNWHHIALIQDPTGSLINLYIDGRLEDSTTNITGNVLFVTTDFAIGARNLRGTVGGFFDGIVDAVRVYNYGISATQVKKLYNNDSEIFFGPAIGSP